MLTGPLRGLAVLGLLFSASGPAPAPRPTDATEPESAARQGPRNAGLEHAFYFTRAVYSDRGRRGFGAWATDYPKADRQFLIGVKRLTFIDAYEAENPVRLDDAELRRFPIVYAVEVGAMGLTPSERDGLRSYLLQGGLLIVDDFWGTWEWENFEDQIKRVLPEYPIEELSLSHPILHTVYDLDEILQVPNVRNGIYGGGRTWEQDGYVPHLRAMSNEQGRILVVINWNTDLGDAWEWADDARYPLPYSNFAYKLGVNLLVYGMSH